jgi:hypothetical protein
VQLLPGISAGVGAPRIRAWFGTIAHEEVIRARQTSVRELVDATELREAFEMVARRIRISEARIAAFVEWGSSTGRPEPMWLRIASLVLPAISIASIGASILWPPAVSIVVTSAFVTLIFAYSVQARTREAIRAAETGAQIADAYAELAGIVRAARFESPLLRKLQAAIDGTSTVPADSRFSGFNVSPLGPRSERRRCSTRCCKRSSLGTARSLALSNAGARAPEHHSTRGSRRWRRSSVSRRWLESRTRIQRGCFQNSNARHR